MKRPHLRERRLYILPHLCEICMPWLLRSFDGARRVSALPSAITQAVSNRAADEWYASKSSNGRCEMWNLHKWELRSLLDEICFLSSWQDSTCGHAASPEPLSAAAESVMNCQKAMALESLLRNWNLVYHVTLTEPLMWNRMSWHELDVMAAVHGPHHLTLRAITERVRIVCACSESTRLL